MTNASGADLHGLEDQIGQWRAWVLRRGAAIAPDIDELEDHLRGQVGELTSAGLTADEAFLVAVKRMGSLDVLSREFAREHSDRLWKQLVLGGEGTEGLTRRMVVGLLFAVAAALAVKLPALLGIEVGEGTWYVRNLAFLVLPFLAGWFVWSRRSGAAVLAAVVALFVAFAVVANIFPFEDSAPTPATEALLAVHLPVLLWFVVGLSYTGKRWRLSQARMDVVRFTGEMAIYFALMALGGGVLVGLSIGVFSAIGLDVEDAVATWLLPMGAAGAVIVAALLVEAKQAVVENMAPVLTKLFTPLFTVLLLAFLAAMVWTRNLVDVEREVLIIFDLLLVVVLALVLYSMSAREPTARPGAFDRLQLVLVGSALAVDLVGLAAMVSRIAIYGPSPNKVAALGLNLLLLVNLAWLGWLLLDFVRGRRPYAGLERWQMAYLPVYAMWAAVVVCVFPPVFGFA
ncbi:permease prefix domain 1-containing protein [Tessaracoccus sp. Z1128]